MDVHKIEEKAQELIETFDIGYAPAEIELDRLIEYLQTFSDQRKKPSESHGLDKWAREKMNLEQEEYSDSDRKLLRKYFNQVEKDILEKSKLLIELIFDEGKIDLIKRMLRQPLKDELRIHICQIIAEKELDGFEQSIINLFLKGTQKASTASFECMRSLKDISFYFPLKKLKPSRHEIDEEDVESALTTLKQKNPEIELVEEIPQSGLCDKTGTAFDISKVCEVLIGQNFLAQKTINQKFKALLPDHHMQIGLLLENNYSAIKQVKKEDYLSSLKKAMGDSLMIGGWDVPEKTEQLLARNLASNRDLMHVSELLPNLDDRYRNRYLKSILNPPKHIKDNFSKKRLFWIYDEFKDKFRCDFENFENFIEWHKGNEDPEIKIETMLLLAALSSQPGDDVIQSLRGFSQDDLYQNYHDRINSALPHDTLLPNQDELRRLSDSALESKLSTLITKCTPSVAQSLSSTLCEYLQTTEGDRFQLVFAQIINLLNIKTADNHSFIKSNFFETLVEVLKADANKVTSSRMNFILANPIFLEQFGDQFPKFADQLPLEMLRNIIANCFFNHADASDSISLALALTLKDRKHQILICSEWVKQLVSDKLRLTQIIDNLRQNDKEDALKNILAYISFLKNELNSSGAQLDKENQKMQRIIAKGILPKLERAKQRAGDQPLLTESYDKIFKVLSDYAQKESLKTDNGTADSTEETSPLNGLADFNSSLVQIMEETSSLPLTHRDKVIKKILSERAKNNQFEKLLQEMSEIPQTRLEWFIYRLIDFVSGEPEHTNSVTRHFKDKEQILWNVTNKMLYRLYTEHQKTTTQIKLARDNKLKEIGKAISEYLEIIEINLFGYYELSENLSDLGLLRIFNKPGETVKRESLDNKKHKVLPTKKETDKYQAITLGLQLSTGETVREAYLESKEE